MKRITRVPFAENPVAILLVVMGSVAVHSFSMYQIGFSKNSSFFTISLAVLGGASVLLTFAYFLWYGFKKCLGAQRCLISDFGDGVVHISPSIFGWVACGTGWIASSNPPRDFQRLTVDNIENFAWGNSDGVFEKYIDDPEFTFPRIAVAGLRKRFWIFIPCSSVPMDSMVIFFNRKSQMLTWVGVIRAMKNGTLSNIPDVKSRASEWQIALKSKVLIFIWGSLTGIVQLGGIYATTFSGPRIFLDLSSMSLMIVLIICLFMSADTSPVLKLMMSIRFTLAGGEKTHLAFDQLPVANEHLFLYDRFEMNSGIDCIALSSIKDMALENWESRVVEGDLKKLFKKGAPPENMVLRLYLDDADDPQREIKLATAVAERWFSELKGLIRQRDTSPTTL